MKRDYSLAYLRYLSGQRRSQPHPASYGLDREQAAVKRARVEAAVQHVCKTKER